MYIPLDCLNAPIQYLHHKISSATSPHVASLPLVASLPFASLPLAVSSLLIVAPALFGWLTHCCVASCHCVVLHCLVMLHLCPLSLHFRLLLPLICLVGCRFVVLCLVYITSCCISPLGSITVRNIALHLVVSLLCPVVVMGRISFI